MADKYPSANGNWSTAANWNGGTLPGVGDDVYADGKSIVIDQNVTVLSIRTTQRAGGTAGGTFTISNGPYTIICTGLGIQGYVAANGAINIPYTGTTNITSNIFGANGVGGLGAYGVLINGNASTINITGNIQGGSGSSCHGMAITSIGSTVNVIGNSTGSTSANASIGSLITNNSILNITGNINSGSIGNTSYGINNTTAAGTINVTGSVLAGGSPGILCSIAGSNLTVIGTITSSLTQPGISSGSVSATATISTPVINVGGISAVQFSIIKIYVTSIASWKFQTETGSDKYLYSAGIALGNPAETDVRDGTTYGAALELTGTLKVPLPATVALGVPTDNTTGTAALSPIDFWNVLTSVAFTAGSQGERLKNCSTVQTTGDQIAAMI